MKFYYMLIVCVFSIRCYGQSNLVSNGSFEDFSSCPSNISQLSNAIGWMSFQQSPDYFNVCATDSIVGVPKNWAGSQSPFEGSAYAGIISWWLAYPDAREFIATKLIEPLTTGSTYFVSFRTTLGVAYTESIAIDHMGAKFTNTLYSSLTPLWVDNNPSIDYPFFITDSINWISVSGMFVADSDYQYLAIGNFFDGQHTDIMYVTNYANHIQAYYYIDSIVVMKEIGDGVFTKRKVEPRLFGIPSEEYVIASFGTEKIQSASIINLLGQQMFCSNINNQADKIKIKTINFPNGQYVVKLNGIENCWMFQFIVQH